jgi:O-methyltransferase
LSLRAADEVRNFPGAVIECGLALEGSGILLATFLKDRDFHGYDVFD